MRKLTEKRAVFRKMLRNTKTRCLKPQRSERRNTKSGACCGSFVKQKACIQRLSAKYPPFRNWAPPLQPMPLRSLPFLHVSSENELIWNRKARVCAYSEFTCRHWACIHPKKYVFPRRTEATLSQGVRPASQFLKFYILNDITSYAVVGTFLRNCHKTNALQRTYNK